MAAEQISTGMVAVSVVADTLVNIYEKTEKFIEEGDWHHPYTDEDGRHSVFNVERGTDHVKEAVVDFLLLSLSQPFDTGVQSTFLRMAKRVGTAFRT